MNARNFFAELKRRNVYKVAIAYAVVAWVLIQVAPRSFHSLKFRIGWCGHVVLLLIIGFPIDLFIAWAFEATPEGIKRTEAADAAGKYSRGAAWVYIALIGAVLSIGLFFFGRYTASWKQVESAQLPVHGLLSLPFVDLSQAHDQEYFCDGISEEILDALAKIERLRVIARTSSFSFKGKTADVIEIAQKLNVQNILEGSMRREGNRIRISVAACECRERLPSLVANVRA